MTPRAKATDLTLEIKAEHLIFKAKAKIIPYDAKSNARRKLYLGYIASNQYKVAEKSMSLIVTDVLIALEIHQVREHLFCQTCTVCLQYFFPVTQSVLDGC